MTGGQVQAGGRIDFKVDSSSSLSVNADVYNSDLKQAYFTPVLTPPYTLFSSQRFDASGWNVLAKYQHATSATSEYSLQVYFDHVEREETRILGIDRDTADIEFQHQFKAGEKHNVIWGMGYRNTDISLQSSATHVAITDNPRLELWSAFIQDEIMLSENRLWLTLASRLEHNDFSGYEFQPNIRAMWKLNEKNRLWAAVAYSVRTPSLLEANLNVNLWNLPPFTPYPPILPSVPLLTQIWTTASEDFDAEQLRTTEIGYRYSASQNFSFDGSLFYNRYSGLRSLRQDPPYAVTFPPQYLVQPIALGNELGGHSYGMDISAQWLIHSRLKMRANYGYIRSDFPGLQTQYTDAPEHIISLNADWSLSNNVDINITWRMIGEVNVELFSASYIDTIQRYQNMDIALNWHISPKTTLSVFGKNLLTGNHREYLSEDFHVSYRAEPMVFGKFSAAF